MATKRAIFLRLGATLCAMAGALLFVVAACYWLSDRADDVLDVSLRRLVYQTDHRAVLEACRQVLRDPQAAGFPPTTNRSPWVYGLQGGGPAPAALPAVLRDLEFEGMTVDNDQAVITFGGGFGHWGTTAAAAPSELEPHWELVPGLWYWTEAGGELPRNPLIFPYYRTSRRLAAGGGVAFAIALTLAIVSRERTHVSENLDI